MAAWLSVTEEDVPDETGDLPAQPDGLVQDILRQLSSTDELASQLRRWLTAMQLGHCAEALAEAGFDCLADLEEVAGDDGDDALEEVGGLKLFERARLQRCAKAAVLAEDGGASMAASADSEHVEQDAARSSLAAAGLGDWAEALVDGAGLCMCDVEHVTEAQLRKVGVPADEHASRFFSRVGATTAALGAATDAAAPAVGGGGDVSQLRRWLTAMQLGHCAEALAEAGFDCLADLEEVAGDDGDDALEEVGGLKLFERARLQRCAAAAVLAEDGGASSYRTTYSCVNF